MGQSLSKNYIHLIFSIKYRENTIKVQDLPVLYSYLSGILNNINSPSICIGGTTNHIHILCTLDKSIALSKMVEEIKRSSSKWIKQLDRSYQKFAWQDGYGAFSVSQSKVDIVRTYILNQEEHHKRLSYTDELKKFLEEYEVEFDERYL